MTETQEQFDKMMPSLTTLNWDQVKFLQVTLEHLLKDSSPEIYQEEGEKIAQPYRQYMGLLDGSNTRLSFPDLLLAVNRFNFSELYALLVLCNELLSRNRHLTKTNYVIGGDSLHPHHDFDADPIDQSIERKISKLVVKGLLLDPDDKAKALELIDEAIKLAKDHGLPYTHHEAARLKVSPADRSSLIPSFQRDLEYHLQRGELSQAYDVLYDLVRECHWRGDIPQTILYLDQARELLTGVLYSDTPIAPHPDFEGGMRLMMRRNLVNLNLLRKQITS